MARALTVILVEKASPNGRRVEIPDGGLQGLYLVIQPSGAKSWAYRYRLNGKTRKYTIGAFPKVDLVNARKLARDTPDPYTPHGAITASERAMWRV